MIGIKPAPSDHESNFKKVGAICVGAILMEPNQMSGCHSLKTKDQSSLPGIRICHILPGGSRSFGYRST